MEKDILNLEEACDFLNVSERTLIKLLREEHLPARKIGREWRFGKQALTDWISAGDSCDYSTQGDIYSVYEDCAGNDRAIILADMAGQLQRLQETNDMKEIISNLEQSVLIPQKVKLSISYKQKRDIEQVEFKLYWPSRTQLG